MALAAPKVQLSIRLVLQHNAAGVGADGGEQGGEDGDHNLTDALQGFLGTFFHKTHPRPLPKQGGECLLRGIWFLDD